MSRDRLAQMKAERDRARGYGQQQGGATPGSPPQMAQAQDFGAVGAAEPIMYPAQGGQQGGLAPSPQQNFGRGASAIPQPAQQLGGAGYPQEQQQFQQAPGQGYGAQQGMGAQPAGAYPPGGNQYEMQGMGMGNGAAAGVGAGDSMQGFFAEIETISQSLQQLKSNIAQINQLHTTVLNSATNEAREQQAQQELEGLTVETSRLTNSIKLRIKNLSELNDRQPNVPGKEGERNTRRMQVAVQKKKFMDLIQEYREVEAKSREKYRSRMERQYKIVKPDATQEEIRYAMENDQGSQVFANALTQSTRYADARNAYREVQDRHEDIKRIAQTMTELQALFNDMAMLVERQDEQIQTIEASAQDVETNMGAANVQIEKGVVSAKKARRKRIWCFWILLLIVVGLVLGLVLGILSHENKL